MSGAPPRDPAIDVENVFDVEKVAYRYPRAERHALDGVNARVAPGALFAIVGPNGSGKSTLLRVMLGVARPASGVARFLGRPLTEWSRRSVAQRVGVVTQLERTSFPMSARDVVAMGRYPHLGLWRSEGAADRVAVDRAMARARVSELAQRPLDELSGGERQRVRIARALAQEPDVLCLDEPTSALDVKHEMAIFELLDQLRAEAKVTVVVVTHNLNLAARFASEVALLQAGRVVGLGRPREVLTEQALSDVYGWPLQVQGLPGPGPDAGAPQVTPLRSVAAERSEQE